MTPLKPAMTLPWLILSICTLSSCAQVQLRDNEWCGDEGQFGASCFHTLDNSAHRFILKQEWDKERVGMLCTSAASFANWKEVILDLCDESGRCTEQAVTQVNTVARKAAHFTR